MESELYMPPFPQANDLEKVLKIVNVSDPATVLNDELLGNYLDGITSRQARYYIAAAKYLGILNHDKHFSPQGEQMRKMDSYRQKAELIRIVISDRVFGTVYVLEKLLHIKLTRDDVAEIIEKEYPEYTDAIYHRRAQTVTSWLEWINEQMME